MPATNGTALLTRGLVTKTGRRATAKLTQGRFSGGAEAAISIGGFDCKRFILWSTFEITEDLGDFRHNNTCQFVIRDPPFKPADQMPATFEMPAGSRVFGGRIIDWDEVDLGVDVLGYTLQLRDWTADLDRRRVIETIDMAKGLPQGLPDYTARSLFIWFLEHYANRDAQNNIIDSFTYSATSLEPNGPALTWPKQFQATRLSEVFDYIAGQLGAIWRCDYDKILRLCFVSEGDAPAVLNERMDGFRNLRTRSNSTQIVTRLFITGGEERKFRSQTFIGDADNTSWHLHWKIHDVGDCNDAALTPPAGIYFDDVLQTSVGLDNSDSGKAVYVNPDSHNIRVDAPMAGVAIRVDYYSWEPVFAEVEDESAEIELEAGSAASGIREDHMHDEQLRTVDAIYAAGKYELAKNSRSRFQLLMEYQRPGMHPGLILPAQFNRQRYTRDGQPLNGQYLIQQVVHRAVGSDPDLHPTRFFRSELTAGAEVLQLRELLTKALLAQRNDVPQSQTLQVILAQLDEVQVEQDAPDLALEDPDFYWGDPADDTVEKVGYWNMSEWSAP